MVSKFAAYRVDANTEISPETFNPRFLDIDNRIAALEGLEIEWQSQTDKLAQVGLDRIDEALMPAIEQLAAVLTLGAFFSTTSATPITVGTGQKTFIIAEADRQNFAPASYLEAVSAGTADTGMSGNLVSYDDETGTLVIDVVMIDGSGEHSDWKISIGARTNLAHESDTTNPHGTTAAQVGAYANDEPLVSPEIVTPTIWNADNNTDVWAQALQLVRGDGTGKRFRMDSLGDGANGLTALAIVDVATGDRVMEIGADGYVNALSGFKAGGLAIPSILGVYDEFDGSSVTRAGSGKAPSKAFADIPRLTSTSRLSAQVRCTILAGDNSSNAAAGYCYAIFSDGAVWDYSRGDLLGVVTQGQQGNVQWIKGVWTFAEQWLPAHDNGASGWSLGVGTELQTTGIDVTWSSFGLSAIQTDTGA